MALALGRKFDRDSAEKESTTVSTASIWGFPAGSTTVRFLDELDDWTEYWEHYDANEKKFFPCNGDRNKCFGCVNGLNASHRWLANAYIVSTDAPKAKAGYVNLYKVPKSLMSKFIRHYDRKGSVTINDYEVIRLGSGIDTEYDLERGDESDFDFDAHAPNVVNHEEALLIQYNEYYNPQASAEVDDEVPPPAKASKPAAAQAEKKDIGDPPSEPQQTESSDESDEEILTEEEIMKMNFEELEDLAKRAGLELPASLTEATELAEWIVKEVGED